MSSPFVAEIRIFACNFAPTGWAQCNGQLLPISQNTALFSLLGTQYGGDGKSTFALPNFMGNAGVSQGQSTTGTQYFVGQEGGAQNVTLIQSEIPAHVHQVLAATTPANLAAPSPARSWARTNPGMSYKSSPTANAQFAFQAIGAAGSSLPHNNMMPYLVLNFCIALQGVFPPRS